MFSIFSSSAIPRIKRDTFEKNIWLFWTVFTLQSLGTFIFSFAWPEAALMWVLGIVGYLLVSFYLAALGSSLGKTNQFYFVFTLLTAWMNWFFMGAAGYLFSILVY